MKKQKGFTLIELIVSIVILSILGGLIAILCIGGMSIHKVQQHGLKSVVNQIWEGSGK